MATMTHTAEQKKAWHKGKQKQRDTSFGCFQRDMRQGFGGAATTKHHRAPHYMPIENNGLNGGGHRA